MLKKIWRLICALFGFTKKEVPKEPKIGNKFILVPPGEAHPILRRRESDSDEIQQQRMLKLNSQKNISEFLGQNVDISGSTQLRQKFSSNPNHNSKGRFTQAATAAVAGGEVAPYVLPKKNWSEEGKSEEPSLYDEQGFGVDGFSKEGFNRYGLDRFGFDFRGYDQYGFDQQGYDDRGNDKYGYNKSGRRDDQRD